MGIFYACTTHPGVPRRTKRTCVALSSTELQPDPGLQRRSPKYIRTIRTREVLIYRLAQTSVVPESLDVFDKRANARPTMRSYPPRRLSFSLSANPCTRLYVRFGLLAEPRDTCTIPCVVTPSVNKPAGERGRRGGRDWEPRLEEEYILQAIPHKSIVNSGGGGASLSVHPPAFCVYWGPRQRN